MDRLLRACVVAAAFSGCGRIDFGPLADGGGGGDAIATCTQWEPFSTPVLVPAPVSRAVGDEWHPWLSPDGLSLHYHVIYTDPGDLYVAMRATASEPFATTVPVSELNTMSREANPTLTADQRTMVFDTQRFSGDSELVMATRTGAGQPFQPPSRLDALNTAADEMSASFSPDGLELFFVRSSFDTTLHLATRTDATQPFTSEVTLPGTEVAGFRSHHVSLAPDLRELYVASNRPGGAGGYDVYVATRDGRGSPFGPLVHVPELGSAGDDSVDSMSADGTTIYLAYNGNFSGAGDIYTATRSCR